MPPSILLNWRYLYKHLCSCIQKQWPLSDNLGHSRGHHHLPTSDLWRGFFCATWEFSETVPKDMARFFQPIHILSILFATQIYYKLDIEFWNFCPLVHRLSALWKKPCAKLNPAHGSQFVKTKLKLNKALKCSFMVCPNS